MHTSTLLGLEQKLKQEEAKLSQKQGAARLINATKTRTSFMGSSFAD